jgi:hypothetical protein
MLKNELMTEEQAKALYKEELTDIYDVTGLSFGASRIYKNGVIVEQKLTLFIDEKGNKDAIEYLKVQGFEVKQRQKKGAYGGTINRYNNGAGYQIILSLRVQPQEDKEQ